MKILMATSEFSPLASTGELGEQVRTLATELKRLGHEVSVVVPFYRSIREGGFEVKNTGLEFHLPLGGKRASAIILETKSSDGIQVFLVRRDEYFDRSGIYSSNGRAYEDTAERFIFFTKAAVELARRLTPAPEILHCHDWTTALAPVLVKERQLPFQTVLTIHTLEHQGSFWSFDFAFTNLPGSYFTPRGIEFYGRLNFLKGGILYADAVTLPGETVIFESLSTEAGYGLGGVLQENRVRVHGIPHGVEYTVSTPPIEKLLGRRSRVEAGEEKNACRSVALEKFGLPKQLSGMLIAAPARVSDPGAINAIVPLLDLLLTDEISLILAGPVPDKALSPVAVAERKYPSRFSYRPETDQPLLQLLLAGSSAVLLPSALGFRGETIFTALRYGTLPLVKFRSGLNQLVTDVDPLNDTGWGFVYYREDPEALWDTIQRAKWFFRQPAMWQRLVERAKAVDFSWAQCAQTFASLYATLLRHRVAVA
jgi:starch synthase